MAIFSALAEEERKQKEMLKSSKEFKDRPDKDHDIVVDTSEDIAITPLAGSDIEQELLDIDALEEVVKALYWHHSGREQLQLKISRKELDLVGKFVDSFKQRELEHNSLTIPKLYRYVTMYMILTHPVLLKGILNKALKRNTSTTILG